MGQLLKTTKYGRGKGSHYHIVFLNEEGLVGFSGRKNDHTHEVYWQEPMPAQEAVFDEFGNLIQEATEETPGQWVVGAGPDGHVHELEALDFQYSPEPETDDQIAADVLACFKDWTEVERPSIEEGMVCENMQAGDQWSSAQRETLNKEGRACLTINIIEPNINELCGYQREQRTDLRYLPIEGSDGRVADILNVISKQILDQCQYPREESLVFEDASVSGRGLFNIEIDFSQDLQGKIVVEQFPWKDVRFAPHFKQDLTDCEGLVKHKMYSKAKLAQLWPDAKESIDQLFEVHRSRSVDELTSADDAFSASGWAVSVSGTPMIDLLKKEIRVLERWKKIYVPGYVVANRELDFVQQAIGWGKDDIAQLKTIPGFFAISRVFTMMRVTKVTGGIVLEDENPADIPHPEFNIVPVYAKKKGDRFWGKVSAVLDLQREVNKRHSQAIDIGNKCAAYGWFYDATTFPEKARETFKQNIMKAGFLQEVSDAQRPPLQAQGVKFPAEIVQLMQQSYELAKANMSIQVVPGGANDSAAKIMQFQRMKLTGNEYLFDNLAFAKQIIGRQLVHYIQKFYTPERILRILNSLNARQEVTLQQQPYDQYSPDEILALLKEADLTKFDVAVSETAYSPTTRLVNFMLLNGLAEKGYPVPPEILLSLMDMPDSERQKMLIAMQGQQKSAGAEQQSKADMEIDKTLIAQGIIPPAVEQRLQTGQPDGGQVPPMAEGQNVEQPSIGF